MLFDVSGKTACVTGASSGLGRAAATLLAEAGARVVGVARRADALASWQSATQGDTDVVVADLADRTALDDVGDAVKAPFGPVDI
ncbi:MAG: SDR family NAD(P)-dependent oxidoreductase, partial [Pseudomonadota bacterium]